MRLQTYSVIKIAVCGVYNFFSTVNIHDNFTNLIFLILRVNRVYIAKTHTVPSYKLLYVVTHTYSHYRTLQYEDSCGIANTSCPFTYK